jgi:hypothetical protein
MKFRDVVSDMLNAILVEVILRVRSSPVLPAFQGI